MREIFVNLKRFEVPRASGGLCPVPDPAGWIKDVIFESVQSGLGDSPELHLTYLLPEGLVLAAVQMLQESGAERTANLRIGSQTVHWEDVKPGGNFGAFTSSLPAAAARNLGCSWAMIGHSEERKAKIQILGKYDPALPRSADSLRQAADAINRLLRDEVRCALSAGLNVLLCVGETAQERGEGPFEAQQGRIRDVLSSQLLVGLETMREFMPGPQVVIGYEPVWAIGPGKIPPGREYIAFVSAYIKEVVQERFGFTPAVVYGGGLKEENAPMIASIETIDGGLVALTRFTGQIGFEVQELKKIVAAYLA